MIDIAGCPVLSAAEMRAAEARAFAAGSDADTLMARAGEAVASAARRFAGGDAILVLCGPGNNGGDGYVAASALHRLGHPVRVAAAGDPGTDVAARARARWSGTVERIEDADPAAVVIDAMLGIGATRPLADPWNHVLARMRHASRFMIAVDVPTGVDSDAGTLPPWLCDASVDLTLALGAVKPAHVLQPSARGCGVVRLIDLGVAPVKADVRVAERPELAEPGPDSHKYSRGMVAIVTGRMAGAARLAGEAALRSGAGYVALYGDHERAGPAAIVHRAYDDTLLDDPRIGALVVGPGLGRDDGARAKVAAALGKPRPLLVDGDALHLVTVEALRARRAPTILTPHAGEFRALFGDEAGTTITRARMAAERSGCVVVLKGPTTVVADATRAVVTPTGNPWLSTAGTGDVLAGAIAAQLAHPDADSFAAATAGVWLHGRAAHIAGRSFLADDLARALTPARAGA